MAAPTSFPTFKTLSPGTKLHTSSPASPGSSSPSPAPLILLCTWMGASPRHIAKYTAAHHSLYPASPILLIQTSLRDMLWTRPSFQRRRLSAARAAIAQHLAEHPDAGIAIHSFSNGGAFTLCTLLTQLAADPAIPKPLPVRGTVFDSAPGSTDFSRAASAMLVGFPLSNFLLPRLIARAAVLAFLAFIYGTCKLVGRQQLVERIRRMLLDGSLVPQRRVVGGGAGLAVVRRTYIYSKKDKMVDAKDVESHAREAKRKGFEVTQEEFTDSGHVAHALTDGQRYWTIVKGTFG